MSNTNEMDCANVSEFLIIGGGIAGCVLATRLKERLPNTKVIPVETGPNEHDNSQLVEYVGTLGLAGGPFQYNYKTAPQRHYNGRQMFYAGGKLLSGSSSV